MDPGQGINCFQHEVSTSMKSPVLRNDKSIWIFFESSFI